MNWKVANRDVMEWAADYDGPSFHALLSDPPYELGFMGKSWDRSGIAFKPATWEALAAHLHPGAFLMAFASARGWHRQAVAMEQAGLIMHPTIFGWAYSTGFPKATRIKGNGLPYRFWAGHRYGLQAMKPAVEPILVFQKPYEGRSVDCITATGAGALNINAARIGTEGGTKASHQGEFQHQAVPGEVHATRGYRRGHEIEDINASRWPSNLILMDREAASRLDEQSGITVSGAMKRSVGGYSGESSVSFLRGESGPQNQHGDEGGASRFFFRVEEQIDEADPIYYMAKANHSERNAGLDHLPAKQKVYNGQSDQSAGMAPGSVEDKFTTKPARNNHPCVKPIALAKYLATLLLPPTEYEPRRILIPFAGSFSDAIGAMQAGWDEIVIIEREAEYAEIGKARLKFWQERFEGPLFINAAPSAEQLAAASLFPEEATT